MTKIACYSDLHGTIPNLPKEKVDLAIFSGDLAGHSPSALSVFSDSDFKFQVDFLFNKFVPYLKTFDCPVVFIAGNHDRMLSKSCTGKWWNYKKINVVQKLENELEKTNIHYLNQSCIKINGLRVYGIPHTPYIDNRWAFPYPEYAANEFANQLFEEVPLDTDILVTHGPPAGILDSNGDEKHYGCPVMAKFISYKWRLRLSCFGHSHARGIVDKYDTKFVNAAISGGSGDVVRDDGNPYKLQSLDPIIVEI